MWWPGTELNRRRQPFQGCALPPELPGHVFGIRLNRRPRSLFASRRLSQDCRPENSTMRNACGTLLIITKHGAVTVIDRDSEFYIKPFKYHRGQKNHQER